MDSMCASSFRTYFLGKTAQNFFPVILPWQNSPKTLSEKALQKLLSEPPSQSLFFCAQPLYAPTACTTIQGFGFHKSVQVSGTRSTLCPCRRPPFPPGCCKPFKPCFHHDFVGEIPEWGLTSVRLLYALWWLNAVALCWNFVALLARCALRTPFPALPLVHRASCPPNCEPKNVREDRFEEHTRVHLTSMVTCFCRCFNLLCPHLLSMGWRVKVRLERKRSARHAAIVWGPLARVRDSMLILLLVSHGRCPSDYGTSVASHVTSVLLHSRVLLPSCPLALLLSVLFGLRGMLGLIFIQRNTFFCPTTQSNPK
jgi:hypothetical protein